MSSSRQSAAGIGAAGISEKLARGMMRAWFATASRVAPTMAERQAAAVFMTPRRRSPRVPIADGIRGRRFTVRPEGRRLAAWSWGEGPTVLLVHGWSGRAGDMAALASAISRAGFRAVAVDMPAHGHSSGRRTSLAEWKRLLPALAHEIRSGAEPLHAIVGHSIGGAAVALAIEAGLRPRGAVLLAPARGPIPFLERVRRHIGLPETRAAGMERQLVQWVGHELSYFDAARAARYIAVPSLILHDPDDQEVPWHHAEAIAHAWHDSHLERATGEGHYAILKSARTKTSVARFVKQLDLARHEPRPSFSTSRDSFPAPTGGPA